MKPKLYIHILLMTFGMLMGAFQGSSAAERFYIDDINIEPDETATLTFKLESYYLYYGFQADLQLPAGLGFVLNNGKPNIELTGSTGDNSLTVVSNMISENTLRFGTFSTSHQPINGSDNSLFSIKVQSSSDFEGGEVKMDNILFVNGNDEEVSFPPIGKLIGIHHNDSIFIRDFNIPVGESKEIALELINESVFTAFQVDIIPPKGLDFNTDSFKLTSRAANHAVSVKRFDDGRIRVACFSIDNTPFTGSAGAVLNMVCTAEPDIAETAELRLNNVIFTTSSAREYILDNSSTGIITVTPKPVESELIWNQNFRCMVGESVKLEAYSSEGYPLEYYGMTPDGGFCSADIQHTDDDEWIATFNSAGAYIIKVSDGEKEEEKRFNVVSSHDGLMEIRGLYYRYADDNHDTLKVVRGYDMYTGDYVIPASVNGLPVVAIDDMAFYSCKFLNDVIIEDGIERLGTQSFGNSSLHSIDLPASVRALDGVYVFNALNGDLSSISMHGLPPHADETTFNGFVDYSRCVLHISEGTYPLFRQAPIWENFADIQDDLPQFIHIGITENYSEIEVGMTCALTAVVNPGYALSELHWRSDDDSIAVVNQNGVVTGVSDGTTEIIAYIGDIYASATVSVGYISGINPTSVDDMSIYVSGHCIRLRGEQLPENVRLFGINGMLMDETVSDSTLISFDNLATGIYVLSAGDKRVKIAVP